MRTVLVVEDEEPLRAELAYQLEQEGYRVVQVSDGAQALERFRADKPDLVLLDLMIPQVSGIEFTRIVRRESDTPILILTAKASETDKVVGLELGADDYVTKPFSLRELLARVNGLLRRRERTTDSADEVTLGNVTVDLAGHRLLHGQEVRPIKPKAFELLAFLLRNQGQVFSREQLLSEVWGYDFAGETRTVDVHMHWLRREIEPDPANPALLQTVRGVGYVLRK
jgi:DNA-binding response OmpR family regulator